MYTMCDKVFLFIFACAIGHVQKIILNVFRSIQFKSVKWVKVKTLESKLLSVFKIIAQKLLPSL